MVKTSRGTEEERERLLEEKTRPNCSWVLRERERERVTKSYSSIPILVSGLLESVHTDTANSLLQMVGQGGVRPVQIVEECVERLQSH